MTKLTLYSRMGDVMPLPSFKSHADLVYVLDFHPAYRGCVGVLTGDNIDIDHLPRFESTGEIKGFAVPKQLRGSALADYLAQASPVRPQNQNLRTAGRRTAWTAATRPNKPRTISDEQLSMARELRGSGCTWPLIAQRVKANVNGLRTALRYRGF